MTTPTDHSMSADPGLRHAAERLAHLGFVVVGGSHPEETGASQLLVALRSRPTLEHFDPEQVDHWAVSAGRVVDRVEAFNSFLSFGGEVTIAALDADTTIAVFESPAPILRSTGHSQAVDPLTGEVGAFFARIKVPIDFSPGVEPRIAALSPRALHGAMLAALGRRYAHAEALREAHPAVAAWVSREAHRMRQEHPADWEAGDQLTVDLQLDRD